MNHPRNKAKIQVVIVKVIIIIVVREDSLHVNATTHLSGNNHSTTTMPLIGVAEKIDTTTTPIIDRI